jgi:hypothetical protein
MKNQYLWLAMTLGIGFQVAAQNKLRYSYQEHEKTFTILQPEADVNQTNFMVWDRLEPQEYWRSVEERINMNFQMERTIQLDSTTFSKSYFDWPAKVIYGHYGYQAFDVNGDLIHQDSLSAESIEANDLLMFGVMEYGYHPGLPNFNRIGGELLEALQFSDYSIDTSDTDEIVIKDPGGSTTTIYNYVETSIQVVTEHPEYHEEEVTFYEFFNGIGFLPVLRQRATIEYELDSNVIFFSETVFSNHQINDFAGIMQASQTAQNNHLRLFPVPMETELTVQLINLPNDEIRGITIRDFQGNPVQFVPGNNQTTQTISLQGVPSGFITVEVSTIGGVQSRLSLKN